MNYKIEEAVNSFLTHYNHKKYWRMKFRLQDKKVNKLVAYYYVYKMKKMETFNSASLGTRIDGGSFFEGTPIFPHALKGIIISPNARIGKNAKIFQQVTIGIADFDGDKKDVPIIGNNVTIGAGAKILGAISVGDNVKIGANAVITKDVPDNCTIVGFNNIIKTN